MIAREMLQHLVHLPHLSQPSEELVQRPDVQQAIFLELLEILKGRSPEDLSQTERNKGIETGEDLKEGRN